jgi:archaetidylinositol phosphate synthase
MVLDRAREATDRLLSPVARRMGKWNPDRISWFSFLLALFASLSVLGASTSSRYLLIAGMLFLAGSGILDALDGLVARLADRSSPRGDFLDHVLDRYSDIALILGFTFSFYSNSVALGIFALTGIFMTSYLGTQAQAVGLKRIYGGILGRADRIIYMLVVLLLEYFYGIPHYGTHGATFLFLTPFDWLLLFFGVAGNITAVWRALSSWRQF